MSSGGQNRPVSAFWENVCFSPESGHRHHHQNHAASRAVFCTEHVRQALTYLEDSLAQKFIVYTSDFQTGGLASGLAQIFDDVAEFLNPQRLHLSRLATFGTG
jgi:hypothetical protein